LECSRQTKGRDAPAGRAGSNGSADVGERLITKAGIRAEFEQLISVESETGRRLSRPRRPVCGVPIDQMLPVAVHPWDIDGAARAGMRTAWIKRSGGPIPSYFWAMAASSRATNLMRSSGPLLQLGTPRSSCSLQMLVIGLVRDYVFPASD
jgi:hypothetical protein